jgi:hypothetical protein
MTKTIDLRNRGRPRRTRFRETWQYRSGIAVLVGLFGVSSGMAQEPFSFWAPAACEPTGVQDEARVSLFVERDECALGPGSFTGRAPITS